MCLCVSSCVRMCLCVSSCVRNCLYMALHACAPTYFFFFLKSKKITGEQGSVTIIGGVLVAKSVEAPVFVSTRFIFFFSHAHQMSMDVHTETTQIHSQKQRNLVNTKICWWRGRTHTHSYKYTHSHVLTYNDTHTYMHTQSVKKKH